MKKCIHCGSETIKLNPYILKLSDPPLYLHSCSHCGATYYDNEQGTSSYARFSLKVPDNYEIFSDFEKLYSNYKDMIDKYVNDKVNERVKTLNYDEIISLNPFIKSRIEYDMLEYRKKYSGYDSFNDIYRDYKGEINAEFHKRSNLFFKQLNDVINEKLNDKLISSTSKYCLSKIKDIINNNGFKYNYFEKVSFDLNSKLYLVEDKLRDFIYSKILTPIERFGRDNHRKEILFGKFVEIFKKELEQVYKTIDPDNYQQCMIDRFNDILNKLENDEYDISII